MLVCTCLQRNYKLTKPHFINRNTIVNMEIKLADVVLLIIWITYVHIDDVVSCPTVCTCSEKYVNYITVQCFNLNTFPSIDDYPRDTGEIHITLEDNAGVPTGAFKGLTNIEAISISGAIGSINVNAFTGINSTTVSTKLTFSGQIATINSGAFRYLTSFSDVEFTTITINNIDQYAFDNSAFAKVAFSHAVINNIAGFAFRTVDIREKLTIEQASSVNSIHTCAFSGVSGIKQLLLSGTRFNTISQYGFGDVTMYDKAKYPEDAEVIVQGCRFVAVSPIAFHNMRGVSAYRFTSNAISIHLNLTDINTSPARLCYHPVPPPQCEPFYPM